MSNDALELLRRGAAALRPHLQPSGELNDPVFGEPTQYGTPYYAYVQAVLAKLSGGDERAAHLDAAVRGLSVSLDHLLEPDGAGKSGAWDEWNYGPKGPASAFTYQEGSPWFRNLRDFMWPPVMRTLRILRELQFTDIARFDERVRQVDVPGAFSERAPVNWAAVWILGEWQRMQQGLSPHPVGMVDQWLAPFFGEGEDVDHGFYRELSATTGQTVFWSPPIDLDSGLYREPGLPNSYDLWCRVHLLELLVEGYDGMYRQALETLLVTGLRRSLGVQLSNGSLATAFRSSGHFWNVAGQCWYFHNAAQLLEKREPELAAAARAAALRAFAAAQACLRPTGDISPVENVLPGSYRVGYEVYTMEAHYVSLPLGYLATAVLDGFTGHGEAPERVEPHVLVEEEPTFRALVHADRWSVHLNLAPMTGYDSFGIADVTAGVGRRLRFGGQGHYGRADADQWPEAHKLFHQTPFTLGIGVRDLKRTVRPLSAMQPSGARTLSGSGSHLEATATLGELQLKYEISVDIIGDEVHVVEGVGDRLCSLFVPYLRDRGDGMLTEAHVTGGTVDLRSGNEHLAVAVGGTVERTLHLPYGYESRHGLLGLIRLDLASAGPVRYSIRRIT